MRISMQQIIKGCDQAIFCWACGLIYFLPIATGLTEWGAGLIIVTYLVKRTLMFISQTSDRRLAIRERLMAFFRAYRPNVWFLSRPLAFFVVISFLSVVFSQDLGLSLKGFIFKWMEGVLLLVGFMEGIKTRQQIKILFFVFMISATVVGLNGLFQAWTGAGFIHGRVLLEDARVRSSLKHANDFGGYLIMAFPLALTVALSWFLPRIGRGFAKPKVDVRRIIKDFSLAGWLLGLGVILYFSLGLALSRGAWLGFFSALVFIGCFRRRLIPALVVICILFGFTFFPKLNEVRNMGVGKTEIKTIIARSHSRDSTASRQPNKPLDIIEHIFGSSMGRTGYWREALSMIGDYPVIGAGLNTYSKLGGEYRINWGGYPHNCYLHMTAETGLLGLAAFVWLLVAFYRGFLRHWQKIQDPFQQTLLLGYTASFSGFLIHSFFDTNLYSVQLGVLFWYILATVVKIQQIEWQSGDS